MKPLFLYVVVQACQSDSYTVKLTYNSLSRYYVYDTSYIVVN